MSMLPRTVQQWEPSVQQLTAQEQAAANLIKAQTAQIYMQEGVLDQETVLKQLSNDDDGDYTGVEDSVVIDDYEEEPQI